MFNFTLVCEFWLDLDFLIGGHFKNFQDIAPFAPFFSSFTPLKNILNWSVSSSGF